jgi:hypothetical protein
MGMMDHDVAVEEAKKQSCVLTSSMQKSGFCNQNAASGAASMSTMSTPMP